MKNLGTPAVWVFWFCVGPDVSSGPGRSHILSFPCLCVSVGAQFCALAPAVQCIAGVEFAAVMPATWWPSGEAECCLASVAELPLWLLGQLDEAPPVPLLGWHQSPRAGWLRHFTRALVGEDRYSPPQPFLGAKLSQPPIAWSWRIHGQFSTRVQRTMGSSSMFLTMALILMDPPLSPPLIPSSHCPAPPVFSTCRRWGWGRCPPYIVIYSSPLVVHLELLLFYTGAVYTDVWWWRATQ